MNIWFYIFISYLVLQGLISLVGGAVAQSGFDNERPFFLKRIINFIIFIIISPLWHILVLLTYMKLIITVAEYKRLTGMDLTKSRD